MAIKALINTREPGTLREFQARMTPMGRIRTGVFETPPGKRGRPAKLDRFRFTSPYADIIEAIAEQYGGTVEPFDPQGAGRKGQWQVTSDADRVPVYIVNGQRIDPTYEAWQAGGRKIRSCDGEYDTVSCRGCLCNGLARDDDGEPMDPPAPRDMCKPTTRVNLLLKEVEGIGSWLYESHGENFALETGGVLAHFVGVAPVPVPAVFCLDPEVRQHRRPDGSFEKREFYVARLRVANITPQQMALGNDVITKALQAGGSPAVLAAPVSAPALMAAPAAPAGPRPPEAPAAFRTVDITISQQSIDYADRVAGERRAESRESDRERDRNETRTDEEQWHDERLGARAEAAVWKWLHPGVKPELHVNKFNGIPDVAPFDVKAVTGPNHRLLHRPHEARDRPLLLVLGSLDSPDFKLLGWRWGWECERDEWWDNPNGAPYLWMVPQSDLYRMDDRSWQHPPANIPSRTAPAGIDAELRGKILRDIERQTDMDGLQAIRAKLTARGIDDKAVKDAWNSKKHGIQARLDAEFERQQEAMLNPDPDETDAAAAERAAEEYADRESHDDSEPWRVTEFDTPPSWQAVDGEEPPFRDPTDDLPQYQVGDTVTVGGIEFTKRSDYPFPKADKPCLDPYCANGLAPCGYTPNQHLEAHGAAAVIDADREAGRIPEAVEGSVEAGGVNLPMPPAGDYTVSAEMAQIMVLAGQRKPPMKTGDVIKLATSTFGVRNIADVTAYDLVRLRMAMAAGQL